MIKNNLSPLSISVNQSIITTSLIVYHCLLLSSDKSLYVIQTKAFSSVGVYGHLSCHHHMHDYPSLYTNISTVYSLLNTTYHYEYSNIKEGKHKDWCCIRDLFMTLWFWFCVMTTHIIPIPGISSCILFCLVNLYR